MRWPAVKKTPLLVNYLACHCGCDVRRFMLWFSTHDWKRSVNGMRRALTAESAGRRCQKMTLRFAFPTERFRCGSYPDAPQPTSSLPVSNRLATIGWPLKDVAHFQKAILHIVP